MLLSIKHWPDPFLFSPCKDWDFSDPPQGLNKLLPQDMLDTLVHSHALGLAANQVGVDYRVILMHVQASGEYLLMFNPELIEVSAETCTVTEGCLSFPGVELLLARPKAVDVSWYNRMGVKHRGVFNDIDARCFLHELDHLNGRVFKEYVSDLKFNQAVKRAKNDNNNRNSS